MERSEGQQMALERAQNSRASTTRTSVGERRGSAAMS
jgi:hypothetical protein